LRYAHHIGNLKCPEEGDEVIYTPCGIYDKPQALSIRAEGCSRFLGAA